jgi:hypothetical protein
VSQERRLPQLRLAESTVILAQPRHEHVEFIAESFQDFVRRSVKSRRRFWLDRCKRRAQEGFREQLGEAILVGGRDRVFEHVIKAGSLSRHVTSKAQIVGDKRRLGGLTQRLVDRQGFFKAVARGSGIASDRIQVTEILQPVGDEVLGC